jgi:hypothetical protein
MEVHTAEPLVPAPSRLEAEIAIAKSKKYKSPGSDPAELIQAGGEILLCVIHKLINFIWNKEELNDQWKVSIIIPVHKNCDKTLSSLLLSRLSLYIDEIFGDHQCGFCRNRSTTDQIFCICHPRKKWKCNKTVHHLFIDFKKACDSVRREVLYNIFIEFGVPMKLIRLIK